MKKLFLIFLAFILLDFSFQNDCSSLSYLECTAHLTDYKLKCQKIGTNSKCVEVEVDDYCKIDSSGNCIENDNIPDYNICTNFGERNKCKRVNEGENCYFDNSLYECEVGDSSVENTKKCVLDFYKKNCIFMDKTCEDYSDDNCGNIATKNGVQCVKFDSSSHCQEIAIDNYCEIKSDKTCGKKEGQTWSDLQYECKLEDNKCQRREISCEEKESSKCDEALNQNCRAIKYPYSASTLTCKIVQLNSNCKIEEGECKDRANNIPAYEECGFTPDYSECKPIQKLCNKCSSSCSNCQVSTTGVTCSQISQDQCKEILIHPSCQVKEDGTCSLKSQITGKTCQFNSDSNICALVDSNCVYNANTCTDNESNKPPSEKKCDLIRDSECGTINKECSDLTSEETCTNINNNKCFWYSVSGSGYGSCLQYTTDDYCEVADGSCQRKKGKDSSFGDDEECLFSREILTRSGVVSCTKKDKCTGSWDDCSSHSIESKSYCTNGETYCKKIILKDGCEVNSEGKCVHKDPNYDQRNGICVFDDKTEKNFCQLGRGICSDYIFNTCGNIVDCVYYPTVSRCVKTDNYCTINENTCSKKDSVTEIPYKKCIFDNYYYSCFQNDKSCDEIDADKCNNTPRKTNSQCFNFGDGVCNSISIDEYCYVDTDGKCKNLLTKLSQYEECAFNYDKTSCKKRDKKCSDYNDDNCGNFTPESKLCYNFGNGCFEVDNNCQIDENEDCVAKSSGQCTLDNDKKKCSYKSNSNNGRFLSNLKYSLLLALFILF